MVEPRCSETDHHWMRQALELAERARGRTHPNPLVGAIIVRDGALVGQGYHPAAGQPHAEVFALREAGTLAQGATLYVTLEPCNHHGRTPPCTEAVLAAGIKRVVIAARDPNPLAAGGVERLRSAGVEVVTGCLEAQAWRQNVAFFTFVTLARPYLIMKYAMSLDGRIASDHGDARWISGPEARVYAHRLRDEIDAIVVGRGTVAADDPRLDTRLPDEVVRTLPGGSVKHPIRVVVDSAAQTPPTARVVQIAQTTGTPTWIAVTQKAPEERVRALEAAGAEVLRLPAEHGRVSLKHLRDELARRRVLAVLLEGGATLNAAVWRERWVDRVDCIVAPKVIGGRKAMGPLRGPGVARVNEAARLVEVEVLALGQDWLIRGNTPWGWRGEEQACSAD